MVRHSRSGRGKFAATIGGLAVVGLLAAGCGSDGDSDTASKTTEDGVLEETETSTGEKNRRLLESALGGGDSIVCDFTDLETQTTGKMFIQSEQNFFLEAISDEGEINMLKDIHMLYMWGPGTDMAISVDTSTEDGGDDLLGPGDLDDSDLADDVSCEEYGGSMDIFDVPSDVEFMSLNDVFEAFSSGDFEEFPVESFEELDFGDGN